MARKFMFADESGNFDFRDHERYPGATRYFTVGTLMIEGDDAVQAMEADLLKLKRDLAWKGVVHDGALHATQDPQVVRDAVFDVLRRHQFMVDVTLVEKAKAQPHLRSTEPLFFQYSWFFHFNHVAQRFIRPGDELMVVAASLGTKKKRSAFKAAVENVVTQCTDFRVPRNVQFWPAEATPCLQAADYAVWAVQRHWENRDERAKIQLGQALRSEYDYFRFGSTYYYGSKPKAS